MSQRLGKSANHLILRGTKYYYRKSLPSFLHDRMGLTEIKISLNTSSVKEARIFASFLEIQTSQFFQFWRGIPIVHDFSAAQIRDIVVQWIRKKREEIEKLRAMNLNEIVVQIDGSTGEIIRTSPDDRVKALQEILDLEQEKLAGSITGDTFIEAIAAKIAEAHEIPIPDLNSFEVEALPYRMICREIRKAFIDLGGTEVNRIRGNYGDYADIANEKISPLLDATPTSDPDGLNKPPKKNNEGRKMSELLDSYLDYKRNKGNAKKTLTDIQAKGALFIEIIGDPVVKDLEDDLIYKYLEALKKIPANRTKKKKYRKKSLPALLKMNIPEKDILDEMTIRNHISKVKSFILWMEKRGILRTGQYSALFEQKRSTRLPHEAKDVFSNEDLKAIFNHADYLTFKKPWQFWVPLLGLYTGMRLNEICQLHLEDIEKDGEIWYIHVSPGENKTLKTQASIRKIPIHDQLQDIGFISYVKHLKRERKKFLFPDRMDLDVRPGHTPGNNFNRWIKSIGIISNDGQEGKKCFHSFRHTFGTRCKELGLDREMTAEIMGHSEGRGQMRQVYMKPAGVQRLYEEIISRLNFEIQLSNLENYMKESGYDPWGKKQTAKKRSGKQQKTIKRN